MDKARHQNEALDAIKNLSDAIERRRAAEAEVGKAHRDLSILTIKNASSGDELNSALREFSETAMHW